MSIEQNRDYVSKYIFSIFAFVFVFQIFAISISRANNTSPILMTAQPSDPKFDECDPRAFVAKTYRTGPFIQGVRLSYLDLSQPSDPLDPEFSTIDVGNQQADYTYNAMAYNPVDNYLYAIKQSDGVVDNKDLLRIGSDGVPRYVGTLNNLNGTMVVAEIGPDGKYYAMNSDMKLFIYDLNQNPPLLISGDVDLMLSSTYRIQEFALYDNYLWGIANDGFGNNQQYRIVRYPLSGPMLPQEGSAFPIPDKSHAADYAEFTSMFAAANGIYGYDTKRGLLYKIIMGSGDLSQMTIQKLAKGEVLPGSDGAKCPDSPLGLPAEIVVTKVADQSTLVPGQPVTFTITVTNEGPWGADGLEFSDPLPAGATGAQWTCTPSGGNAKCTPASGNSGPINTIIDLPDKGGSVTLQVTMQTDPIASSDLVNTATVVVPIDFEDNASNNTATATVPLPGLEFSASKVGVLSTAPGAFTAAGDVINYTVTVKNDAGLPFANVTVTDPGPLFGGVVGTGSLSAFSPASATIDPGFEKIFTATYTITEQDLANLSDAGTSDVLNTAIVTVTGQSGRSSTKEAPSLVQVVAPAINLQKTGVLVDLVGLPGANGEAVPDVGDRIEYTLTIKNTGSVPLENVVLADAFVSDLTLEQSDMGAGGVLAPGATATYKASHIITPEDLLNGQVLNNATVSGNVVGRPDLPAIQHSDDHLETVTAPSTIVVEKSADTDANDADGILNAGDPIFYTVTLTNGGFGALQNVYPVDEGPTFGGEPGSGILSPFEPGPVTLNRGQSMTFRATYILSAGDMQNAVGQDSIRIVATATGHSPDGKPVERVNVAEALLTPTVIEITKRAVLTQVVRGGPVPYVITLKAPNAKKRMIFDFVDTMPVGFTYLKNTAQMNGNPVEPKVEGRRLLFSMEMEPNEEVELTLQLFVSPTVTPGEHTNYGHTEIAGTGVPFGQRAEAKVEIIWEHVFDCGDLIGQVFDDKNRNGIQDQEEPGVPGVRLVAVDGITATTDSHGRYHLTCADLPDHRRGSTFLLKLDPRSLPVGTRIISENPRSVRLTAGKVTRLNFATSISRVVRVDINSDAFHFGEVLLRPEWEPRLEQLISILQNELSVLRVSYIDRDADRALAAKRVEFLRDIIRKMWQQRSGRYRLEIESRILNQLGQGWDEPNSISWVVEPQ